MKKKVLLVPLALLLAVGLVVAACAPTPTPTPTPEKPEITSIQIFAGRPGDHWTVLTEALVFFINADSEWLTASCVATGGVADSIKILFEEPEKRDSRVALCRATDEVPRYRNETDLKPLYICSQALMPILWVTFNPDIKSIEDFAGKAVGLPRTVPGYWDVFEQCLIDAGVRDTIKDPHGGFSANKAALMDGTVEVGQTTFNYMGPDKMGPDSNIQEMMARRELYPIDYTKERIERVAEVLGFPPLWLEVPAGSLPNQPEPIYVVAFDFEWYATADVSDEIAYEVARIAYAHASEGDFVKYHPMGEGLTGDSIWQSVWLGTEDTEDWYHPGALKFYKEIGLL